MHIASWRTLPLLVVTAIAAVMFWALVSVFGSESTSDDAGPIMAAPVDDGLERIPLEFPEVAKPLIEALPSPTPSPIPSPETAAAPVRKRSTTTTTRTRNIPIPSDGATGNAVTGASGDPMIGPDDRSDSVGGDDDDIVGDLDDEFDDVGPDDDEEETPEPDPEPTQDEDGGLDVDNSSSGSSGNNGANGSSETATDDGEANEGEVD